MKDNLKGTKEIAPEQWSQAIAKAKPRFRKGSEMVQEKFGDIRRGRERDGLDIREEIAQIREKAY